MAGYSGTPLIRKLGFAPGMVVRLTAPPADYLSWLGGAEGVAFDGSATGAGAAHVFLHAPANLPLIPGALAALAPGGMLWLSWAKKSSPLHAGITEDSLRDAVLPLGWVDVKVCAVSADWSGLKFLRRRR
ncbi:MAG: hypothetical protein KDK12_15515 [Rhodobacteraceae bacterium]|nr:hypothetical protein [Paracoccaceae bacterium]